MTKIGGNFSNCHCTLYVSFFGNLDVTESSAKCSRYKSIAYRMIAKWLVPIWRVVGAYLMIPFSHIKLETDSVNCDVFIAERKQYEEEAKCI